MRMCWNKWRHDGQALMTTLFRKLGGGGGGFADTAEQTEVLLLLFAISIFICAIIQGLFANSQKWLPMAAWQPFVKISLFSCHFAS